MSYYSDNPRMVRVDFFKKSGKWYDTIALEWVGEYGEHSLIYDEFIKSLGKACLNNYHDLTAVCLNPYHTHEHPLMVIDWWEKYQKLIKT